MAKIRERRHDIDIARAIAMIGVVWLHINTYFWINYELEYFHGEAAADFRAVAVGRFTVTVFMFVAGMTLSFSSQPYRTLRQYGRFAGKKFARLILPFLAASLVTLAVKLVAPGRGWAEVRENWLGTLIAPEAGAAPHLWFLYCLMGIFLVWPLLVRLTEGRRMPIVLVGLFVLAVAPIPYPMFKGRGLLTLNELTWWLPVFTLGYWYGGHPVGQRQYGVKAILILLAVTVLTALAGYLTPWSQAVWRNAHRINTQSLAELIASMPNGNLWVAVENALRLLCQIFGAVLLVWICGILAKYKNRFRAVLETVGFYSYDIYLLHVALVGHPVVFAISKLHPGPVMTYVLYGVALVVTVVVPMGIGLVIRRIPPLAFVMLGVPLPAKREA
ncbi:MAG: acyltransferase [Phycisphaerae bacterium]|nr:acyltransferase [Phycisphaerae bacterium]